jgi:hypothetical protein
MHNIVHNMADELGVSNHLTIRNGVCQYVRRVPEDVRAAFPFTRVQKSLGTRDQRLARAAALDLDQLWDRRFAEARRAKGLSVLPDGPAQLDTEGWSWPDWQALATWFGASLAEQDWRARLRDVAGGAFASEPDATTLPRRDGATVSEHIARGRILRSTTVAEYASTRLAFVQSHVRRLGISLSRTAPEHERFMAACLGAELAYLDVFQLREARRGGLDRPHPDIIAGPWRKTSKSNPTEQGDRNAESASIVGKPEIGTPVGKTLAACRAKWIENRTKARKQVRPEYLREMDQTVATFERHADVSDIGAIRRRHVLAFRDYLGGGDRGYKTATINKKVGFITSLMGTALNAGWVETALGSDIFLEVPEDEGQREPYAEADLAAIFAHPIFTAGHRFTRAKACGELQFWLPLIACLHGMISSEILQLGPDTVMPHPDAPEILCFVVTNAGDRRVKTLARRRYVPIRRELLDLGFSDLVAAARREGHPFLWSEMRAQGNDVTRVSGYFSSFWASFSRRDVGITTAGTSLYGFRHAFQDRLAGAGFGDEVKKALMGHADSGMTGRYGTKRQPRAVNIIELDKAIHSLKWAFLSKIIDLTGILDRAR